MKYVRDKSHSKFEAYTKEEVNQITGDLTDNLEDTINETKNNLAGSISEIKNDIIVDYRFDNNTTNKVEFNVDIQPNEKVEIEIHGGGTSKGDVYLTINNISEGYYQSGFYFDGTNGDSQGTLTQSSGYRPNM
jgi:hypothetical protein